MSSRRRIVLLQLPIPPLGPQPIRGNIPLAAGYLTLFARRRGLEQWYDIEILPPQQINTLGDAALVEAIRTRQPWLVGFSCYLWNVERALWLAEQLRQRMPDTRILIGGPEISPDNTWVLANPAVDYAVIGEGEATFAELLTALHRHSELPQPIPGLLTPNNSSSPAKSFIPRTPIPSLDLVASPYLEGILDPAEEQILFLETVRGCVFRCKFCYYPKSYDGLYFLSAESLRAILRKAREAGVREVVLLDPTLNQRRDLPQLLRILAEMNPNKQWTCFGELRAEGINDELAQLLRSANFTEVEVGLQSIEPRAMRLMDRNNNLRAFERGVTAMRRAGIRVKVDLIIGLPGDTADSIRRSMDYLKQSSLYDDVQVFHLMVLPGTDFRREAQQLGLSYQSRPPYYVTRTADLELEDMFRLMHEASEIFELQWDELPNPEFPAELLSARHTAIAAELCPARQPPDWTLLHLPRAGNATPPRLVSQAFTAWFRSENFHRDAPIVYRWIGQLLGDNPFLTLTVVLEPTGKIEALPITVLQNIRATCLRQPTYLDRYYSVQPGRAAGAKRLIVYLKHDPNSVPPTWVDAAEQIADIIFDQHVEEHVPCRN